MRHVTLLCRAEDAENTLETLRDAGVVHLRLGHHLNHDVEREEENLAHAQKVIQKLESLPVEEAMDGDDMDPSDRVDEILCREQELLDIQALDSQLAREQRAWEPFGDIETATLAALRDGGVNACFYRAPGGDPVCPEGVTWIPAREGFGVAVALDQPAELEADRLNLPVRGPRVIRQRRAHLADMTQRHRHAIARHTAALDELRAHRDQLADELAFTRARMNMREEGDLAWISGFVPESLVERVREVADRAGAALSTREPTEEDPVPTLLDQSPVVSWIQPVLKFLGVTPGYREADIGWSFLLFLSIFSGIIVGDAGYGLILVALVLALNAFKPATRGKFANLLVLMGVATFVWGALSGNFLGLETPPFGLERLKVPALSDPDNPVPIMKVCFLLGATHLTLAHVWNMWRKRGSLQALADLGWIGSTWTMYLITGDMVLGQDMPGWTMPLFAVSALLIVLFMTPPAKFREEWFQHVMLPLTFVNNFVDVVSYVRLYAVGMATLALASSFNEMILGGDATRGPLATGILLVILALGHLLNFVLAGMGVMVHGIRLNTLEFASHIGLGWSGVPYEPFKKKS